MEHLYYIIEKCFLTQHIATDQGLQGRTEADLRYPRVSLCAAVQCHFRAADGCIYHILSRAVLSRLQKPQPFRRNP